jgi:hypothetical protein
MRVAAIMEGAQRGITKVRKRFHPEQPIFSEASKRVLSMFFKAAEKYRKTRGYNCIHSTIIMPRKP